ncbi:YitT family protein [Vagococcus xieshaowenii]|uniref:YitT family protein n=1 Tax=Vagococcus xieshaowenii TaxID=2562451 RepID=A0AAJ5EGQ9_9ENTE|nr:YitT family protein [Vagococcus xieshaowenii]QCA29211.1 YitT family protein [Vagococcus xieshaowenii]TFZ43276.1 YitT family protein [Vagococcus xieshaowenii]
MNKPSFLTQTNHEYLKKVSVSVVVALMSSIALNVFWHPGGIYASGVTGIGQIIDTGLESILGINLPFSVIYYGLNIPLFIIAWCTLSKKFTIFTMIEVTLTAIALNIVPTTSLTTDPLLCAIFGGAINGFGVGLGLKNGVSTGGLDIIALSIRKKTGKSVGSIAIIFNVMIALIAGYLFGWRYGFYSVLSFFISGKVMDATYTKQQKMQVMIITKHPQEIIDALRKEMRRGVTIINDAKGAYDGEPQTVLFTVITAFEMHTLEEVMKETDPCAFVSISEKVRILGNFYDPGL